MGAVTSKDPATAGGGDAASWMRHYKLKAEDMVYIPMVDGLKEIASGDMLWFAIEGELCGGVRVDSVEDDVMNNRQEIWFKGSQIRHTLGLKVDAPKTGEVRTGDEWLKFLREP